MSTRRQLVAAAFPAILVALVLVPTAALLGFAKVGMTMTARARTDPQWMREIQARGVPADAPVHGMG